MNQERQNIVMAELAGWRLYSCLDPPLKEAAFCLWYPRNKEDSTRGLWWSTPDYQNDLNELRAFELEFIVKPGLTTQFEDYLAAICARDFVQKRQKYSTPIHASAVQRCEAALRTLKRWEE